MCPRVSEAKASVVVSTSPDESTATQKSEAPSGHETSISELNPRSDFGAAGVVQPLSVRMSTRPALSTATQRETAEHESARGPSARASMAFAGDQLEPSRVNTRPSRSTATQKSVVGHDTAVREVSSIGFGLDQRPSLKPTTRPPPSTAMQPEVDPHDTSFSG
jgi:hypothetical protein